MVRRFGKDEEKEKKKKKKLFYLFIYFWFDYSGIFSNLEKERKKEGKVWRNPCYTFHDPINSSSFKGKSDIQQFLQDIEPQMYTETGRDQLSTLLPPPWLEQAK